MHTAHSSHEHFRLRERIAIHRSSFKCKLLKQSEPDSPLHRHHLQSTSMKAKYIEISGRCLLLGGGGLVASGRADELRVPSWNPGTGWPLIFSKLPSGQRSPTCCHNAILDGTAKLYARGASAGSMSLSIRNEAALKKSSLCY